MWEQVSPVGTTSKKLGLDLIYSKDLIRDITWLINQFMILIKKLHYDHIIKMDIKKSSSIFQPALVESKINFKQKLKGKQLFKISKISIA